MARPPRLPARMLVDLPNWVGDQMMAMPAVHRLVEANRGGETILHTRPAMRRFLASVFPKTRVLASPRKSSPLQTARTLSAEGGRFAVGITLRNSARAKILIALAARWTVGSRGEGAALLLSRARRVDRSRHQVFDGSPVIGTLGLSGIDPTWRPAIPPEIEQQTATRLADLGLTEGVVVGIAPATGRGDTKRWPAENFGRLTRRLADAGHRPLVLVGPGEEHLLSEVRRQAGASTPGLGTDLDVAGLAGVVAGLDLLVCNDSGPMHLAWSFGIPTVALFGPSEPRRTAPLGDGHQVLYDRVDCAPCSFPVCPQPTHACMLRHPVERVEQAVVQILEAR